MSIALFDYVSSLFVSRKPTFVCRVHFHRSLLLAPFQCERATSSQDNQFALFSMDSLPSVSIEHEQADVTNPQFRSTHISMYSTVQSVGLSSTRLDER